MELHKEILANIGGNSKLGIMIITIILPLLKEELSFDNIGAILIIIVPFVVILAVLVLMDQQTIALLDGCFILILWGIIALAIIMIMIGMLISIMIQFL